MDQISPAHEGIFADDRAVIKKIEDLLPQKEVRFLVERLSLDHFYEAAYVPQINELIEKFGEIGFNIQEPVTGVAFDDFKAKFLDLNEFLQTEMGVDPIVKGRFSIDPRRKNKPKIIRVLKTLTSAFNQAYKKLLETALEHLREQVKQTEKLRTIHRDVNGDYFMKDRKIVMSKNTLYYHAFDIVISQTDQNDKITYRHIQKELEKRIRSGEIETITGKIDVKKIQNALGSEQLFNLARINGARFKNQLPNREKILKSWHGKGYEVNNPSL